MERGERKKELEKSGKENRLAKLKDKPNGVHLANKKIKLKFEAYRGVTLHRCR